MVDSSSPPFRSGQSRNIRSHVVVSSVDSNRSLDILEMTCAPHHIKVIFAYQVTNSLPQTQLICQVEHTNNKTNQDDLDTQ